MRGELGAGGMGVVYRAWDPELRRDVALKVLSLGAPPDFRQRFLREGRMGARLKHPGIVAVHAAGEADGQAFIVQELIEGESLSRRFLEGPLPPGTAARILEKVARALSYAHAEGVVHRDVKPGNILLDRAGDPHLADFGLAREADASIQLSRSGEAIGTPHYMSPEQAEGKPGRVDARTDIWGCGVVLYQALSCALPFEGGANLVMERVLAREPVPLRRRRPSVPRQLEAIVDRCLEKDPGQRYPTAEALADDLARFLRGEPTSARPIGPVSRIARRVRRNPVPAAVGVVALALGAAGGVAALWWATRPAPWRLVFEDDFERADLGEAWANVIRGDVRIHDGALCSRVGHVALDLRFADDVALEVTATVQPDARRPVEASVFLSGTPASGLRAGYSFEHGIVPYGESGATDLVQRLGRTVLQVDTKPLVPGVPSRLEARRDSGRVVWTVDGRERGRVRDRDPLEGDRIGIGSNCDHIHYDDLRVWQRLADPTLAALRRAQGLARTARPDAAAEAAGEVAADGRAAPELVRAATEIRVPAIARRDPIAASHELAALRPRCGLVPREVSSFIRGLLDGPVAAGGDRKAVETLRRLRVEGDPDYRSAAAEALEAVAIRNPAAAPEEAAALREREARDPSAHPRWTLEEALAAWDASGRDAARLRIGPDVGAGPDPLTDRWRRILLALLEGTSEGRGRMGDEARESFVDCAVPAALLSYAGALGAGDPPDLSKRRADLDALARRPHLDVGLPQRRIIAALSGLPEEEIARDLPPFAAPVGSRDAALVASLGAFFRGDRAAGRAALERYLAQEDPGSLRGLAREILAAGR
ncbi:MAG: serine/threonine protein kinase [Planctomycetales bacterium]|nr:serine/threonine protein kinase [Planctomycetales bacterium]